MFLALQCEIFTNTINLCIPLQQAVVTNQCVHFSDRHSSAVKLNCVRQVNTGLDVYKYMLVLTVHALCTEVRRNCRRVRTGICVMGMLECACFSRKAQPSSVKACWLIALQRCCAEHIQTDFTCPLLDEVNSFLLSRGIVC